MHFSHHFHAYLHHKNSTPCRGILENAGAVMAQRQLLWDMGIIYPGLKLKLGPTIGAAGLLEFVLDPSVQNDERSLFEEKSTGKYISSTYHIL